MKAEPKKAIVSAAAPVTTPTPAPAPSGNALWQALNSNSPTATYVWSAVLAVLLIALAVVLVKRLSHEPDGQWQQLDVAGKYDDVKRIADANKGSSLGKIARLHQARTLVLEGTTQIASMIPAERKTAAGKLEEGRTLYKELAGQFREPIIVQECLLEQAKVEEWLSSVPTADDAAKMRGSLDAAKALYDDLVKRYPDSFRAADAKARVKELTDDRAGVAKFYESLVRDHNPAPVVMPPAPESPLPPPTLPEAPKAPPTTP